MISNSNTSAGILSRDGTQTTEIKAQAYKSLLITISFSSNIIIKILYFSSNRITIYTCLTFKDEGPGLRIMLSLLYLYPTLVTE